MNVRARKWTLYIMLAPVAITSFAHEVLCGPRGLAVPFKGRFGQVEVGGPYAGAEFHGGRPLPSRISFFYPVANSVDVSTDYWKRGESRPMVVGVSVDGGPRRWIGKEGWEYLLSPHRVEFSRSEEGVEYRISYDFCLNEPAMVFTLSMRNVGTRAIRLQGYTHLQGTLRTCQTYARLDSASTAVNADSTTLIIRYVEREAGWSSVLVGNAGARPTAWTTDANELGIVDTGASRWIEGSDVPGRRLFSPGSRGKAAATFVYEQDVPPGDSLSIVQYIASCRLEEADSVDVRMARTWKEEIHQYDALVTKKAYQETGVKTGDAWVDSSAIWARGILAANAHHLDGAIVPMPCPAEYNFYFTHDVLLTDLAAVNFDPDRVRRDFTYIMSLAEGDIIPHAYYWKDDGFKKEMCTPDNWNHLWFILLSGSYLRHTGDTAMISPLYPLVTKSLTEILKQRRPDGLMHAFRPDWWDIGRNEGPRSFITILTIRALREYQYLSSYLRRNLLELREYERMADEMQEALLSRLWDRALEYLINFNGDKKDAHFYMGSILAAPFGVLPPDRTRRLMETATSKLVAPGIGVRTVFPVDFNTDSVRAFFKLVDNEAGDPFLYANGGVWPHNNAWYTLGLQAIDSLTRAFRFFRETMTLQGVANSPMGHPAMYEYRFSDPSSPEYGRIDKPSFLWAGGFYLFTLYRLVGVYEDAWNISLGHKVPAQAGSSQFDLWFHGLKGVQQHGAGREVREITADGKVIASRVLPLGSASAQKWNITLGKAQRAYLDQVNAIVEAVSAEKSGQSLHVEMRSFDGHTVRATIVSPRAPKRASVDGKGAACRLSSKGPRGAQAYEIEFPGTTELQVLTVSF